MSQMNTTVLMSDALNFMTDQPINPYYGGLKLDHERAVHEHDQIVDMMRQAGINVVRTASPTDSQDGVYTANWALVRGNTAVLANLPEVRATEHISAKRVLKQLGKQVYTVPEGLKFSGQGDALACGNLLFCGAGYRSDEAAQAYAAEVLGYERIQLYSIPQLNNKGEPVINAVSGWPDSFFYDIDLALSVIKAPEGNQKGLIAYCPEAFTDESRQLLEAFDAVEKITVSMSEAREAFAMNLVSTGETVIMSNHAPEFTAKLNAHGLKVLSPDITELLKGGGYIRCTTLTLD